jgi:hypothetical protein
MTMLGMAWRNEFLRSLAAISIAAFLGGCAAADVDPTGAGGEGATLATGGQGGEGGDGGQGGEGGTSLCATDCSAISPPACHVALCNDGSHPGPVGQCIVVAADNGTACDDGKFCTTDDACQAGVCTGGPPNDCGMVVDQCEIVECDESAKACVAIPTDNGTPCTSSDLCLAGSTCSGGICTGGTFKDCFFSPVPNECHAAICNPANGMCEPIPANDGQPCTDTTDLCTINKSCAAGACVGGTPKSCSHLTVGCNLGVCDTANGQCTTQAVMDGQLCDDLNACTTGETCSLGSCGNGTPVTTCSLVADGCCPSNCTEVDDFDCQCMPGSLVNYANNNGLAGIMFDIVAQTNVEILGFDASLSSTVNTTQTMEIYYRPGTHVGFETSSAGWTLVGSATVTSGGSGNPAPIPLAVNVQIPQGQTYAFYITVTSGSSIRYQGTGSTPALGSVYHQDGNIQILVGTGKSYPFGSSTIAHRSYTGEIYYLACGGQ